MKTKEHPPLTDYLDQQEQKRAKGGRHTDAYIHKSLDDYLNDKETQRQKASFYERFKRGVKQGVGAVAVAAVVLPNMGIGESENIQPNQSEIIAPYDYDENIENSEDAETISESPIFENAAAQNAAERLGIKPSDYFIASNEVMDNIAEKSDWWNNPEVLPIFPASVFQYKEKFERVGQEYGVSPNFLAGIALIETSGINNLRSHADAHGVMQFVPRYHIERFKDLGFLPEDASYEDYVQARDNDEQRYQLYVDSFNNVDHSITASADFFSELISNARNKIDARDNHPIIYTRAAGAYNGGPARTTGALENLPDETAEYIVAMQRIVLDIAVANELAKTENNVHEAVVSISQQFARYSFLIRSLGLNDNLDYETRRAGLEQIVAHMNGEENQQIENSLKIYDEGRAQIRDYMVADSKAIDSDNMLDSISPGILNIEQFRSRQNIAYGNPSQ